MSHFTPPSKEDIKKQYGISDTDFEVLVSETLPSPEQMKKEETMLEKLADFFGVPTFLLKKKGLILAIIFLPYWGPKVQNEFRDCFVTTYSYYVDVLSKKPVPLSQPGIDTEMPRYVVTVPDLTNISVVDPRSGNFPTGSGIYPFSGSTG